MKRIEFIAPVEAMRGNLSGTQKELEYPTNDNAAYESPVGSRNYAKNYSPKFIGAKRASDGLKYFAVRTKSAIGMTTTSKKQMAVLGGCGAIMAAILRDKTAQIYTELVACYEYAKSRNSEIGSFRKYLSDQIMANLRGKQPAIFIGAKSNIAMVTVNNPWHSTGYGPSALNVTITTESLVKFWSELADNAVVFYVNGIKAIARVNWDFVTLTSKPAINILNLTLDEQDVMYAGSKLYFGSEDQIATHQIQDGEQFSTIPEE